MGEAAGAWRQPVAETEISPAVGGKIVVMGRAADRTRIYLEHFQTHAAQICSAQGSSGTATSPT